MTTNKQLRELAEKAKLGSWFESGDLHYEDARSGYMHGLHHDDDGFIAAASPDRVLALLDENEALQAENEKLVSYTQNGIECFASPCPDHSGVNTPPFFEFQERYGRLCLMCVVDERDALQAECEQLRKDAAAALSGLPDSLPMEPYQTVDRSSPHYKAGWNACRRAMLAAAPAVQGEPETMKLYDKYRRGVE